MLKLRQENKKVVAFAMTLLLALPAFAIDLAQNFNFDGTLLDSAGKPISGPVAVKFEIYDPATTPSCLLFQETFSAVALDTSGNFSVKVGSGTRASPSVDGGLLLKSIFQNNGTVRATSSPGCSAGYTPAAGDGRKLRVYVNGTALTPDYNISPVPTATVAESLQGKVVSDFVSASSVNSTNVAISSSNSLQFQDGSSHVLSIAAPVTITPYSLTLPTTAPVAGNCLSTDAAGNLSWAACSGGGSGVTSVATGVGLTGGPITTSGTLAVDVGTTANKIVQLNGSSQLPAVDGSLVTNLSVANLSTSVTVPKGGTGATTLASFSLLMGMGSSPVTTVTGQGTSGQVLTSNGAGAAPTWQTATGVTPAANNTFTGTNTFNGSTSFTSVGAASLVVSGGINNSGNTRSQGATATTTAYADYIAGNSTGMFFPGGTGDIAFSNSGTETLRIKTGTGNVGIGTTSPAVPFDVVAAAGASNVANFTNSSNANSVIQLKNNSTTLPAGVGSSSNDLYLFAGGNERMRISSAGNVGIGTTSPAAALDIQGGGGLSVGTGITGSSPITSMRICTGTTSGSVATTGTGLSGSCSGLPTTAAISCSPSGGSITGSWSAKVSGGTIMLYASGSISGSINWSCLVGG